VSIVLKKRRSQVCEQTLAKGARNRGTGLRAKSLAVIEGRLELRHLTSCAWRGVKVSSTPGNSPDTGTQPQPNDTMKRQHNLLDKHIFKDHEGWLAWLHESLPRPTLPAGAPVALDLFAGCGGMALGFESQGIETVGFEMKTVAVETYNQNLAGKCEETFLEIGLPADRAADVVIGGPPCQPFSQIGYQRGKRDPRDGFPVFLDAVNRIRPRIAIIENVRGLLYRNKDYFRLVARELERFGYSVDARIVHAVEYGVPQKRERVVIVASQVGWQWPEPVVTHPVSVGIALGLRAWKDGGETSKYLTPAMDRYIAAYEKKSA